MTNNKIIDTIRKLRAQAESAEEVGNEAEAMAFMEKASDLMLKYKVEMTDLEFDEFIRNEQVEDVAIDWNTYGLEWKARRVSWTCKIAQAIAELNNCSTLSAQGSNTVWVAGHESNRKIAEYVIVTLIRWADAEATKAYRAYYRECMRFGDPGLAKGYRKSWLSGLAGRIVERVHRILEQREHDALRDAGALMVINREKSEVEDYMKQFKSADSKPLPVPNHDGFAAGMQAGKDVPLDANAIEHSGEGARRLLK